MSLKENNSEKNLSGTSDLGSEPSTVKRTEAREKTDFRKLWTGLS